jgi:hypothetical protein
MEHMVPIMTGEKAESTRSPKRLLAVIRLPCVLLLPACGPGQDARW